MARDFVLHVPGEVGGKGRPRTRVMFASVTLPDRETVAAALREPSWVAKLQSWFSGKPFAQIYPDPDSARMEKMIKGLAFAQMAGRPRFTGPVELTVEIFLNMPKSWPRAKRESALGFFATGKPDVDNIAKLFMDAFNETVWDDDTQVADLIFRRRFTEHPPSAVATVKELVRPNVGADLFASA